MNAILGCASVVSLIWSARSTCTAVDIRSLEFACHRVEFVCRKPQTPLLAGLHGARFSTSDSSDSFEEAGWEENRQHMKTTTALRGLLVDCMVRHAKNARYARFLFIRVILCVL